MKEEQDDLLWRLKAVSDENRFHLLDTLRSPKTINQIHLTAETDGGDYRTERRLTRQGIQYHLDILRDAGLVAASLESREGRMMNVHQVDMCGLFLFTEQLNRFASELGAEAPPTEHETIDLEANGKRHWPSEPRLILSHGLTAGSTFSLSGKPPSAHRGWIIGRTPKAEIPLPYDPYISPEDAEVIPTEDGFEVLDLRSARNRTYVNDTELDRGESMHLDRGDVIRVGRSELIYQGP